jgi:hypothetical protein
LITCSGKNHTTFYSERNDNIEFTSYSYDTFSNFLGCSGMPRCNTCYLTESSYRFVRFTFPVIRKLKEYFLAHLDSVRLLPETWNFGQQYNDNKGMKNRISFYNINNFFIIIIIIIIIIINNNK